MQLTFDEVNKAIKVVSIREESDYISKIHGDRNIKWSLIQQSLLDFYDEVNDVLKFYDKIEIKLLDGTVKEYLFDINAFYGKYE